MSDNLKTSSLLLRRYQIYFELQKESDDHLSAKTIPLSSKTKFTVCNGGTSPSDDPCTRFVTGGDVPPRDDP